MNERQRPDQHHEISSLIRHHDWASTPLGPIEAWPDRFRGLVDSMLLDPVPCAILWGQGGILLYNAGYAEICGQRHPHVLATSVLEAWPEAADFNGKMLADVLSGQSLVFRNACFKLERNGALLDSWFDLFYGPVLDADGAIVAVKATVVETTQLVQGERQRLAQQRDFAELAARLKGLTTATSDVIYRMSPDWSEMWELDGRGFIKSTESPYRSWIEDYIPEDEQARVNAAIEAAIRGKSVFELEHKVRRVEGGVGWTLSRAVPMLDRDGEIEQWIGAASDISERKAAEEALRESERLFRTMFDSIDEGFCVIEFIDGPHGPLSDYVHVMANPAYAANAGIENVVGQRVRDMVPLEAEGWVEIYRRVLVTGEPIRFERTLERTQRHLELSALRIEPAARRQVAVLFRDVTLRHRAEMALRDLNENLERRAAEEVDRRMLTEDALRQAQKMEAVGQLTGGIAHDFNNMLAVISNALELVRRRIRGDDELSLRYLGLAKGGVTRASQLTQRLLAFSRQQPLHPAPVSVNALLLELSPLLKHSLGGTIVCEIELAGDTWLTYVDSNQLEQVILNLVVNARDAMELGGRLTIQTSNCDVVESIETNPANLLPGSYISIAIRDTGTGMSPEVMAKAFDPFFTTKEVGRGTGLGLSQVYGFVRQSGGQVRIDSELGQGTVVEVFLPRYTGTPQGEVETSSDSEAARGNLEAILVTDDEAAVRVLLGEMLTCLGYRVFFAESGPAALKTLADHPEIRLLVTDVLMPGMNGRELVDEALKRYPRLKVLFTTGYAGNVALASSADEDSIHLLMKPFSIEDLASRIKAILDPADHQI